MLQASQICWRFFVFCATSANRKAAGWQREEHFSDGTLRLLGILWSLPPAMLFRVAVREVEAWLLADREAFAAFVGAPLNKLPLNPDSLDDPKQTLLGFVRRYGRREIKADILPKPGSRSKIGLGYNQRLRRFVAELWEPERATACSDSLARAFARLRNV